MPFNSFQFFVFFPAAGLLYYAVPKKYRWVWLLAVSVFFYLFAGLKFFAFLLCTTATSYFAGLAMGKADAKQSLLFASGGPGLAKEEKKQIRAECRQSKKRVAAAVFAVNFGVLAVLKYANFFAAT